MYMRNILGTIIDPWGKPQLFSWRSKIKPLIVTNHVLFLGLEENHAFHYQVVQGFYQSDRLEDVSLIAIVEIQTVDYKLIYCLQIIYINGCTLSFQGFYQF